MEFRHNVFENQKKGQFLVLVLTQIVDENFINKAKNYIEEFKNKQKELIEKEKEANRKNPLETHYLTKGIKDVIGEDIGLINEVEPQGQFMQTTQHGVINRFTSGT